MRNATRWLRALASNAPLLLFVASLLTLLGARPHTRSRWLLVAAIYGMVWCAWMLVIGPLWHAFTFSWRRWRLEDEVAALDQLRREGRCTRCGYDLTANVSGVCPECGTKVQVPT